MANLTLVAAKAGTTGETAAGPRAGSPLIGYRAAGAAWLGQIRTLTLLASASLTKSFFPGVSGRVSSAGAGRFSWAGRLLSLYGKTEEGNYEGAQESFGRALAIARQQGDVGLEMRTLSSASYVDYWHLHYQESLAKSLRAIELARYADDPHAEVVVRFWATATLWIVGDLEGVRRHASACLAVAERLRHRYWLASALWRSENVASLEGGWQAGRDFSERGLAVLPSDSRLLFTRVLLEYQVGDFSQGNVFLERLLEAMRLNAPGPSLPYAYPAIVIPMVARVTGVLDRLDVAKEAADFVLSSSSATPRVARVARAAMALFAVLRGDVAAAKREYAALESAAGAMLAVAMAGDRLLALLAQTMGSLDQAAAHFEDALTFCHKAGYRPELAWSAYEYTLCLLQRSGPGDRLRAASLLEQSLTITDELRMLPLREKILALQQEIESRPDQTPEYPDGLTQREAEVLRLMAAGRSNSEIAEELVLSIRTVERHITSIYTKANARNRAGTTAYAFSHGLTL